MSEVVIECIFGIRELYSDFDRVLYSLAEVPRVVLSQPSLYSVIKSNEKNPQADRSVVEKSIH